MITLADAQLVLAREWGFPDWSCLCAAADNIGAKAMSAKIDAVEMIPFIPARDFEASVRFYEELFEVNWKIEQLCQIQAGSSKFLIQDFYEPEYANNCMYQLIVDDVDSIWDRLRESGVLTRHGDVRAAPPKDESWGKVLYLHGPAGELWHITRPNQSATSGREGSDMDKFEFFGATSAFLVSSLDETIQFYLDKLGFSLNFSYGDPPYLAQVSLGRLATGYIPVTLQFRQTDDLQPSENYLYLRVGRHIRELFEQYRQAGVEIVRDVKDQPWGMTEFEIRDINDYRLVFGGHTEDQD